VNARILALKNAQIEHFAHIVNNKLNFKLMSSFLKKEG